MAENATSPRKRKREEKKKGVFMLQNIMTIQEKTKDGQQDKNPSLNNTVNNRTTQQDLWGKYCLKKNKICVMILLKQ